MIRLTATDDRRFVCLASLILVGDLLLRLKFTENTTDDMLGTALAFLAATGVILLLKKGTEWWSRRQFRCKRGISVILMLAACLIMVVNSVYTVLGFSGYAAEIMLDMKGSILPFVTFLGLAAAFAFTEKNLLYKAALILFPLILVFIVLIFGFSVQFMSVKYLIPYKSVTSTGTFESFLYMFIPLVTGALPLLVIGNTHKKRSFAVACLLGFGLLALCTVNVVAVFGGELASTLSYPYSRAVSTASMGEVFSRMDGFLYTVCFFTCLIKAASGIFATVYLLKKLVCKIFSQKI